MLKFLKNPKIQEIKYNALQTILSHQNLLDIGMSIARSVSGFAQSKSILSFVEGGVSAFNTGIKAIGESENFFSIENGWDILALSANQQALYDIVVSALENFPARKFKLAYEADKILMYTLPVGSVGKTRRCVFFRPAEINKNDLLEFIIKEKFKDNNSRMFTIVEQNVNGPTGYPAIKFDLKTEENVAIPSQTADNLTKYINKYIEQGLPRSIILNGLPGTGKTTMTHKVFQNLNLKTLKFKYGKATNISIIAVISFLIEVLKIEAVFLEDFDYFFEAAPMLELLEWLHRHTKVVIAITNSLKSFPPAILRPGRFDELRSIECLDEEVIKNVLGDLFDRFIDKVNTWPIAYINELAIRIRANPDIDPEEHILELQERIDVQIKHLKG